MVTPKIIEVDGLKKSYGDIKAVKNVSFYVERGKFFAFLGPNGAGKSTTIDILCTQLKSDAGDVVINRNTLSIDDDKIRREIGVVFQDHLLDPLLTVYENIMTRGSLYGIPKIDLKKSIDRVSKTTGISDFINRPYGKLSGGQKRRADIARALVNTPKILFLDEPTTGLDPQTRKSIWKTIKNLQTEHEVTVFLTTHYMEEAAAADYVVVIDNGLIVAKGTPTDIKQKYSSDVLRLRTKDIPALNSALNNKNIDFSWQNDIAVIKIKDTMDSIEIINSCKELICNIELMNGTMDDAFIGITGKEIRE